jgi:hypothetical protein
MREVNAAWTVLSDADRRADYDRSLAVARVVGPPTGPAGRPTAGPAGSTRPEDADDPDAALARARAAEVDPDEPDLTAAHFWLLRRGPLVAALVLAVVIFVATAYAGTGAGGGRDAGSTSVPALATGSGGCVQVNADRVGIRVDCNGPNDGTIVQQVERVEDCPSGTRYVSLTPSFVCVATVDG